MNHARLLFFKSCPGGSDIERDGILGVQWLQEEDRHTHICIYALGMYRHTDGRTDRHRATVCIKHHRGQLLGSGASPGDRSPISKHHETPRSRSELTELNNYMHTHIHTYVYRHRPMLLSMYVCVISIYNKHKTERDLLSFYNTCRIVSNSAVHNFI